MKKKKCSVLETCPCGSGKPLAECCGQYHAGTPAPDAETLMRSRYAAYALGLEGYLLASWHATTRPASLDLAEQRGLKWIGLQVEAHGGEGDSAWVRFTARYKQNGRAGKLEERSRFVREEGRWYYLDGEWSD